MKPVVDLRIYTMRQGGVPEFLRLAREVVIPVQKRHIGPPVAYYVTDIGPQQEVMHLWGYDSLGEMESRRQARNKDPEWPRYGALSKGLIVKQETSILRRLHLASTPSSLDETAQNTLVEFRVTTVQRSHLPAFFDALEAKAVACQSRHFGAPVGIYKTEIGNVNQVIQLWAFQNYADMENKRSLRDRNSVWKDYLETVSPWLVEENIRMLRRVENL